MLQKLSDDLFLMLQMHSFRPSTDSIYEPAQIERLFCSKSIESDQLLPCADCLFKHVFRANYQQKSGG